MSWLSIKAPESWEWYFKVPLASVTLAHFRIYYDHLHDQLLIFYFAMGTLWQKNLDSEYKNSLKWYKCTNSLTCGVLTKSTLAVKLSVSAIIYPRWTATCIYIPSQRFTSQSVMFKLSIGILKFKRFTKCKLGNYVERYLRSNP